MDVNELPTALDLFKASYKNFNIHKKHCPNCKAKGFLKSHDEYDHYLVDYGNNSIQEDSVKIKRVLCSSCNNNNNNNNNKKKKKTYSVLPDIFIPHKLYNIIFIMKVLIAYYHRTETVEALCLRFGIAVSTLYAWKKRYHMHKSLDFGKLAKYFYRKDPHLKEQCNICLTPFLQDFFNRFGFSFLQYSKTAESGST